MVIRVQCRLLPAEPASLYLGKKQLLNNSQLIKTKVNEALSCHEDGFTFSCMDTCWRLAQNNLVIFLNNRRQWPNRKLMRAIRFAAGELADMHWELKPSSLLGIPAHEPSA